jgi:hypothetical protein
VAGGRPTLYDPEYCDLAIEHMSGGLSIAGLAGRLKVSRDTIYQWAQDHEEFSDALNEARAASAAWWEDRAIEVASGMEGAGAPAMVIFGLKNRVQYDWRDKTETEHSGPNGGPIVTQDNSAAHLIEEAKRLGIDPAALGITASQ